jgi:hypothetical protein
LDHVARLSIVGGVIEAGGDDDSLRVFVKEEAVAHATSKIGVMVRSKMVGTGLPSSQ